MSGVCQLVHFGYGADALSTKGTLGELATFHHFRLLKVRTEGTGSPFLGEALVAPKLCMFTAVFTLRHR